MPDDVQSMRTVPPGCSDPQPGYQHMPEGCVNGHNIENQLYHSMTVQECADKCDDRSDCKAFEYGVDYRAADAYAPRDCGLQDSFAYGGCRGTDWNLDLYIKDSQFPRGMDYCYDPDACNKKPKEFVL